MSLSIRLFVPGSAFILICLGSSLATAQGGMGGGMGGMGGRGGGMGGMGGGGMGRGGMGGMRRGGNDRQRADRDSAIQREGYARVLLEKRKELELTDAQVASLAKLDTAYHATTDSAWRILDSLRAATAADIKAATANGGSVDSLTQEQKDAIVARRKKIGPLADLIRTALFNQRTQAFDLLSEPQKSQANSLIDGPEPDAEARWGGGRGRGGSGGGMRPRGGQ